MTRACGQDGPPVQAGERVYRCSLPNKHYGYHVARVGERVLDSWPRPEDVTEAKRRAGAA